MGVASGPGCRPVLRIGRCRSGCVEVGLPAGGRVVGPPPALPVWAARTCDTPAPCPAPPPRAARACHTPAPRAGQADQTGRKGMTVTIVAARAVTGGVDAHAG